MPNKGTPLMTIKEHGCPFEHTSMCFAPSVKERHQLIVTFQLPPLLQQYDRKADEYISHLVGHEGPGSLLSELKARNWATSLCAGVIRLAWFAQFGCEIHHVAHHTTSRLLRATWLRGGSYAEACDLSRCVNDSHANQQENAASQSWHWTDRCVGSVVLCSGTNFG